MMKTIIIAFMVVWLTINCGATTNLLSVVQPVNQTVEKVEPSPKISLIEFLIAIVIFGAVVQGTVLYIHSQLPPNPQPGDIATVVLEEAPFPTNDPSFWRPVGTNDIVWPCKNLLATFTLYTTNSTASFRTKIIGWRSL